ncbi:MAG: hypothetical protein K0S88_6474, partial [Actinomycetia bacterium]|nr:hypothetical protein [Actinomycetes bacterium]
MFVVVGVIRASTAARAGIDCRDGSPQPGRAGRRRWRMIRRVSLAGQLLILQLGIVL